MLTVAGGILAAYGFILLGGAVILLPLLVLAFFPWRDNSVLGREKREAAKALRGHRQML